jgi:hypothetical protein
MLHDPFQTPAKTEAPFRLGTEFFNIKSIAVFSSEKHRFCGSNCPPPYRASHRLGGSREDPNKISRPRAERGHVLKVPGRREARRRGPWRSSRIASSSRWARPLATTFWRRYANWDAPPSAALTDSAPCFMHESALNSSGFLHGLYARPAKPGSAEKCYFLNHSNLRYIKNRWHGVR